MERLMLRMLTVGCVAATPFIFKRKNLLIHLTIFFSKCVLSTCIDSYCIKSNKLEYPVRPFPKIFDTNVLYDLFMFPLLSIVWVRWTYHSDLKTTMLRSLWFSVPMSLAQGIMEKTTNLFQWKKWSIWHTFVSINFTLFTIRVLVWLLRLFVEPETDQPDQIKKINKRNATHSIMNQTNTAFANNESNLATPVIYPAVDEAAIYQHSL